MNNYFAFFGIIKSQLRYFKKGKNNVLLRRKKMKQVIYNFLSSNDDSILSIDDKSTISSAIIESFTEDTVQIYFDLLVQYLKVKQKRCLTTDTVAKKCDLPPTTIKRFENLQTIPKALTLFKILKSVGLEIRAVPKEESFEIG